MRRSAAVRNAPIGRAAFAGRVAAGGYPEAETREVAAGIAGSQATCTTTFERDIRALADLQKGHEMRRLLSVLSTRSANLLRYASIADVLKIDQKTVKSYFELLQAILLVQTLRHVGQLLARVVHAPKVYVTDTGYSRTCSVPTRPHRQRRPRDRYGARDVRRGGGDEARRLE